MVLVGEDLVADRKSQRLMTFAWNQINPEAADNAEPPPMPPPFRGAVLGKIERMDLASAIKMRGKSAIASFSGLSTARHFPVGPPLFPPRRIVIRETG